MAFIFDTNSNPATGAQCLFKLRVALKAAGWTTPRDSDGTTFSASGTQLTSGGSGAGGLGNTNAWFVIRDPNGVRSFMWQRGSNNTLWHVSYSASAGYTGGSAAVAPTATDEVNLNSTGFQTLFGTDGTLRFNCCAGDTTVGYAFYWDAFPTGNPGGTHYGMCLDVMATGSFPAADTDPAVIYMVGNGVGGSSTTSPWGGFDFVLSEFVHGFLSNTHVSANFAPLVCYGYMDRSLNALRIPPVTTGEGVSTNPFTSKDDGLPLVWARSAAKSAPTGYKGISGFLHLSGTFRSNYDTISNTGVGSRDTIWINGCLLPWDGSVPTL